MAERFIYLLPLPPSSNEAHVHRTARIKKGPKAGKTYTARMLSKEALAFRDEVRVAVRKGHQKPPGLTGRLTIALLISGRDGRDFDIDNRVKQVLDALQEAGVYENDSEADAVLLFRGAPVPPNGQVVVCVSSYYPGFASATLGYFGLPAPWEVGAKGLLI